MQTRNSNLAVFKMKFITSVILLLLFSYPAWSETFDLICDVKFESHTQGRYRIDTDSQTITELGFYSGNTYTQTDPRVFKTIGWDLDQGMLIWAADTKPDIAAAGSANRIFDIIIFDLRSMVITLSRSARRNGLIDHALEFTEPCRRE